MHHTDIAFLLIYIMSLALCTQQPSVLLERGKKSCMATDMHTDDSHHHGNPNSTLYSNSFTRTFRGSNCIGRGKKGEDLELQKCPLSMGRVRNPATICFSLRLGTGFVIAVLLTGPGSRRSQTSAMNCVSGGGCRLEAKPKVTRDVTMK